MPETTDDMNVGSLPVGDPDGSIEAPKRPAGDAHPDTPDAANGAVGGTDGITKNQDDTAQ